MKKEDQLEDHLPLENTTNENNSNKKNLVDEENQNLIPKMTLDSVIDKRGITIYHIFIIIICGLMISCDPISMNLLFLLTGLASQRFGITKFEVVVMNAMLFVGVIISCSMNGKITKAFSRSSVIKISLIVLYISNMSSAWIKNAGVFSAFKFLDGLCVGIVFSNAPVILCEILPTNSRFLILTSVYVFYTLGIIYVYLLFYLFFPKVELSDYSLGIVSVSQLYLVTFILAIIFLEETPRILIFKGENEKAFEILEKRFGVSNLNEKEKNEIIQEISCNANNQVEVSVFEIFSRKYLFLAVLLILIWIVNNMIATGIYSILPLSLTDFDKMFSIAHQEKTKTVMLAQAIITNLVQTPSNIVGAFIGETEFFGRKYTMVLGYSLSILFLVLGISFPIKFYIFIGFAMFCLGISFSSANSYTCEVYPTALRDSAIGFYNGLARVMALLSTFIFFGLHNMSPFAPYIFASICFGISLIAAVLLPYETRGKSLDSF